MTSLLVLLKPGIFALRNRWRRKRRWTDRVIKDPLAVLLATPLVCLLYSGVSEATTAISEAKLPPEVPFEILFHTIFFVVFFSAAVTALSSLYITNDRELILSSPLLHSPFFFGKFLQILWASSWVALVFFLPAIAGISSGLHGGLPVLLASLAALIPTLLIPTSLGIVAATILASVIPAERTREILVVVAVLLLFGFYTIKGNMHVNHVDPVVEITTITETVERNRPLFLPSLIAAAAIGSILKGHLLNSVTLLVILLLGASVCVVLAGLVVKGGMPRATAMVSMQRTRVQFKSAQSHKVTTKILGSFPPPQRAIAIKDWKLFLRDSYQVVQLALVLLLAYLTLYGFQFATSLEGVHPSVQIWWRSFLTVANIGLGSFVSVFVCSRLVFPSISQEGGAFWTLRSSPMKPSAILWAKFSAWWIPISCITAVLLGTGALIADVHPRIVAVTALSSIIVVYGIVGVAVGMGAWYARFDWEHSAQISSGLGNLVYIAIGSLLVLMDLFPIGVLIGLRTLKTINGGFGAAEWYPSVVACSATLVYLNWFVAKVSIEAGAARLEG